MDFFSCSPLCTAFCSWKTWKRLSGNSEVAEMRHCDVNVRLFVFVLSFPRAGIVCEIKRIHHWCSVGTEKSKPEGPQPQWETRLAEFSTRRWTRGLDFSGTTEHQWSILFLIYHDCTVQYCVISVGDVTEVDVYSQCRALYKPTWNSEYTAH